MSQVNADTITDEQIRELREMVHRDAPLPTPWDRGNLDHMFAIALGEVVSGGWMFVEGGGLVETPADHPLSMRRRRDARYGCAEIINALAKEPK